MKVCPFCCEEVRDEAVKCRYCSSSLLTSVLAGQSAAKIRAPGTSQYIYVPDKDVIRFAKALAVTLTVFVAIGLFLYGYEIKQAGKLAPRPGTPGAVSVSAPTPNQTVYILDQGLVRFAKFTAGVLAIFVTVGLFLYGLDIKQLAKEMRAEVDRARQSREEAGELVQETEESLESISSLQQQQASDTQTALERIRKRLEEIETQAQAGSSRISGAVEAVEALREVAVLQISAPGRPKKREKPQLQPESAASFSVPELARLYDFPSELDGRGQCIGLIELGGGYLESDLQKYFAGLGLIAPIVTSVSVDGVGNSPKGSSGFNSMVTMNIEVAGAVAPAAHIVVYFAPNTDQGFLNATTKAVEDGDNAPSVLVVTWGGPEKHWTKEVMAKMNKAFQAAAEKHITVLTATGDSGHAHVIFPASSPWVLACGGTRIIASGNKLVSEVAWNEGEAGATGGVSSFFTLPDWQSGVNVPAGEDGHRGRGIPDLAANASPHSGYTAVLDGNALVVGGTSASTSFLAGLIALMNQGLGRNVGFINPLLYSKIGPAGALHSIAQGDNDGKGVKGYSAEAEWHNSAGWGSPNGRKLLDAFRAHS